MSLRSALAARSGLAALANRSARRQVERGDPFKRRGRVGVLTDAIEYRQTVSFWYYKGDQLIAVDAMNDPRAYMVGKRLIDAGKTADPAVVADPAADLKPLLKA